MKISKFVQALVGLILLFAFVTACDSVSSEQPMLVATPSLSVHQDDNATSGAMQRSTRQALSTLNAKATLNI